MSIPLDPNESYQTLKRDCDDPHAAFEANREIKKPEVFWEGKLLHPNTSPGSVRARKSALLRTVGANLISNLARLERPFFVTARIIETKTPDYIDLRVVVICSEQPLDPKQCEQIASNPPEEA